MNTLVATSFDDIYEGGEKNKENQSRKQREDAELTGSPVARARQLKLDQLIPAAGVRLRRQFEIWVRNSRKESEKPTAKIRRD